VADGPHRISNVALDVGFSDISHFNRLFRAPFGDHQVVSGRSGGYNLLLRIPSN
jgi:methylphosphotriester-DNA--protein-cysteine methyltransferase